MPRSAVAALVAISALGILARFTPETWEWGWALRIAGASLVVGVVPGAAMLLAYRPCRSVGLPEWLGVGLGFSCASAQLITIAAVTLHQPPTAAIGVLAALTAASIAIAWRNANVGVSVRVAGRDVALVVLLAVLWLFLYAAGAPYVAQQEERIHISLIQRLSRLPSPSLDNIYLSPGVVYTYPFPGTHYLMALMSRVGDIEPIFLYHKLRAFWGVAAMLLLWGCARVIFEGSHIALAVALVAIAFVMNGTFGAWSQMAPFSHAADVAMGVLLPALLFLTFSYFRASEKREARFFLAGVLGMAFMLIMVHPREIVQFLVYLGAFLAAAVVAHSVRPYVRRTALLLMVVSAMLLVYRLWYQFAVAGVESIVIERRQDLATMFRESSWATLLGPPLPLLDRYMPAFGLLLRWWTPVVLLTSPFIVFLMRSGPLVWFPAFGILIYCLVTRYPALAIPYIYTTYFEILYAPVRNVAFFVHLFAGVSVYLLVARLTRYRYAAMIALAASASAVVIVLFNRIGPAVEQAHDALFVPLFAGYALAIAATLVRRQNDMEAPEWLDEPKRRLWLALALVLAPVVAATWQGESAVGKWPLVNQQPTPAALLAGIECGEELTHCVPPPALIEFVRKTVPAEAIFAVDYRQVNEPSMVLPQQVDVWSGAVEGLVEPEHVFPVYYRHLDRARAAGLEQPLFNDRETRDDRLAFVRDLDVTHLLLTPRVHQMMTSILARDADVFVCLYDDGRWAVYQVKQ